MLQESLDDLKKEFSILYLTQYSLDQTESKLNQKMEAIQRLIDNGKGEVNTLKGKLAQNEFEVEEIRGQLEREDVANKLEKLDLQFNESKETLLSVSAFDLQSTNKKITVLQNQIKEKLDYDIFDN